MNLEQELRVSLRQAADELGLAHPVADVGGQGMRALAHSRSRRRVAVLSAGLAVLVIGVGIPTGLSLIEPADNSVAAPPSPESIPSADIYGGPTRGSLADDAEFVEAVRQLPWTVDGYPLSTEPPVESRRVVFVGDVPQARWALVIGEATVLTQPTGQAPESQAPESSSEPTSTSQPAPSGEAVTGLWGTWFVGVAGADPAQMRLVKDFPISPDEPASMFNPTTGTFVVVAAPGDLISVSPRPEVAADGSLSRTYVDVESNDGVATTVTQPASLSYSSTTVQYRVTRPGMGVVMDDVAPSMVDDLNSPARPAIEIDNLRAPGSAGLGRQEQARLQDQAGIMLVDFGLPMDEVAFQQQYYGPITTLPGSVPFSVITMTFPSGAVLTSASRMGDEPECNINGISAAPASGELPSLALRCDLVGASSLVILAPTDYAGGYAVAEGSAGSVRVELDSEGVGMIAFPDGATSVTVFAADGTMVDEVPIFTT